MYNIKKSTCKKNRSIYVKILQITHYGSLTNYGALLQAFALQEALKELGHDVTLLRASFSFNNVLKKWYKSPLRVFETYRKIQKELQAEKQNPRFFREFAQQHMNLSSEEYHSHKDLLKANLYADALVTGSDQVWSSKLAFPPYFLEFGPTNSIRFSYAASVGSKARFDEKYLKQLKTKTSSFKGVSVREHDALLQCQKAGVDAILVPDPVMLFSKEDWIKKLSIPATTNEEDKYCLVYTVSDKGVVLNESLIEYCKKNNLKIKIIISRKDQEILNEDIQICNPDIPTFISLINNASKVVTDSFHGTVFSILCNTPFVVIPKNNYDSRFATLNEYFNISNVYSKNDISSALNHNVDFCPINEKLESLRTIGWDFLKQMTE